MDKFAVSPEDCLVLKAFRDSNSLREAASLLNCDPAGLARRVQTISSEYGFLQKVNNRWKVTARGLDLVAWVEESIQSQKSLVLSKSSLRIASTIWFSECQIIPNLPKLKKHLGDNSSFLISYPSMGFEQALTSGSVDYVIVCHPPANPEIEHRRLVPEKWLAIAPIAWRNELKGKITETIKHKPFIRHADINENLLLPNIEITLSEITIDNLTGVRSAVQAGLGWSLAPKFLVNKDLKEENLFEVPLEIPVNDRNLCVWWLRNRKSSKRQASKICAWMTDVCS
ncbi:MAG: LysR family transcriptional regulator [Pseudobdellovibrionaceae bacterium]